MQQTPVQQVVERLRQAVALETASDAELLTTFIRERNDSAFAELVRRHGPMVWGVCRRLLPHQQDAEDCYQATFLVLLRKAGTVCPAARVGAWLHGVAYHTALKARQVRTRREHMEKHSEQLPEPATPTDTAADLRQYLDRGLSELPEKYRVALVLCELEGWSLKEAAQELGCPIGTLAGWLSRGRTLLARRLGRHGTPFSAAAFGALLAEQANAALPAVTTVTTTALALTNAVLRTLFVARLRSWLLATVATLTLALGMGGWLYHGAAQTTNPVPSAAGPGRVPDRTPEPIAWGKEVDGVQYGFEFKQGRNTFAVGDKVTFVIKARNVRATPTRIEQVEITGMGSVARDSGGAAIPTVRGLAGQEVKAHSAYIKSSAPEAKVHTFTLAPGETVTLGEVAYTIGCFRQYPYIDAWAGTYRVHFDTVCWLKGHQRPTGTLPMFIIDPTAWGPAVNGIEHGVEFKDRRTNYRVGEKLTLVFKARNVGSRDNHFEQVDITTVQSQSRGVIGAATPTVVDGQGRPVSAWPLVHAGNTPAAGVREYQLIPRQIAILGEAVFTIGDRRDVACIDAQPGPHRLSYSTISWVPGHRRPTGALEFLVVDALPSRGPGAISWGPTQGDLEFGVSLAGGKTTHELGERIDFTFHARCVGKAPISFQQFRIAQENEPFVGGADTLLVPVFESGDGKVIRGQWNLPAGTAVRPPTRKVDLAPGETVWLGTIGWQFQHRMRPLRIDPGHYTVSFKSVMAGTQRPPGKLQVRIVLPKGDSAAAANWGKEVNGLRFGVDCQSDFNTRHVGQSVIFVLKAANVSDQAITFEQVGITGVQSLARGVIGAAKPTVIDAKGKAIPVLSLALPGPPAEGTVRTLKVEAGETIVLGEVEYALRNSGNPPRIEAPPGRYRVRFDTVCWLPGHQRPTGSVELTVLPWD